MEDISFQVIFTGTFAPGMTRKEVLANLSALLRREPAEIRAIFHAADAVIIKRTSREQGQKYVDSLNQTGALCTLRKLEPVAEPAGQGRRPLILRPLPGPSDLSLSAMNCANAGGNSLGLTTNRKDWSLLPFAAIRLLACFKTTDRPDEIKLLLFTKASRRPLLIEGNTIAFAQFPGVPDGKLFPTFRKFLRLLYRRNPTMVIDFATAEFMKGAAPPQIPVDPIVLICDLHRAYLAAAKAH